MDFAIQPIGVVHCRVLHRYEAPRQGSLGAGNEARVVLREDDPRLGEALAGIEGFERIWLLTVFHLNRNWRPLVQPPRLGGGKIGVFATRSPHRPNRLGLSCVELLRVEGLVLHIRNHDILDRTPVVDIKPYLPYADAFPGSRTGWVEGAGEEPWTVEFAPGAEACAAWIAEHGPEDIATFARLQLGHRPTDGSRKRIREEPGGLVISYRMWRLAYVVDEAGRRVRVQSVRSGYTTDELARPEDPHGDKAVHRAFRERFGEGQAEQADVTIAREGL